MSCHCPLNSLAVIAYTISVRADGEMLAVETSKNNSGSQTKKRNDDGDDDNGDDDDDDDDDDVDDVDP